MRYAYEPTDDYDYPADPEPATPEELEAFYADWPDAEVPTDAEIDAMVEWFGLAQDIPF